MMPKLPTRWLAIALIVISFILLTLFSTSARSPIKQGSSYSRAPDGYGAWYAFMEKRGTNIQRWQRPFQDLAASNANGPTTLLRVLSRLTPASVAIASQEQAWVAQGNRLVILGINAPATEAAYTKSLESKEGKVLVNTTRRFPDPVSPNTKDANIKDVNTNGARLLGDEFGAAIASQIKGKGEILIASTPHIAANAYQDFVDNYEFLAKLVTQNSDRLLIDEYIHGYKDSDVVIQEGNREWSDYLIKTPLLPAILQLAVVAIVLIVAQNRRFGLPVSLKARTVDNSAAYIQALAAVLSKAQSSEFVLETIGKAEQLHIQRALGLDGQILLDRKTIVTAWVQQTRRPANEILSVLQVSDPKRNRRRKIGEPELKIWLANLQTIHKYLP